MSERQIDCAAFARLVDHYFDEDLVERDAMDAHVAGCATCRAAFAVVTDALSDLPCQTFVELVTDYLERAMPTVDRTRMTRHLELCEGCREYVAQLRTTIELAAATPDEPPDPVLRAALVAAYRAVRGGPPAPS
jgi:predicted anti-sigma-YlaC factor YlaD